MVMWLPDSFRAIERPPIKPPGEGALMPISRHFCKLSIPFAISLR